MQIDWISDIYVNVYHAYNLLAIGRGTVGRGLVL